VLLAGAGALGFATPRRAWLSALVGRDMVRIRILVTVAASDAGQAAVSAWDVFSVAAGEDTAAWDLAGASAEIRPAESALTHRNHASFVLCPVA
jgi:hypothetical protein